jgi:hypothetical protein
MQVGTTDTLFALSRYGEYSNRAENDVSKSMPRIVLKRVYDDAGRQILVTRQVNKLSFFDRIKLFFGHNDFRLQTIQSVAQAAIQDVSTPIIKEDYKNMMIGVSRLNRSISSHNSSKIFWIFSKSILNYIDTSAREPLKDAYFNKLTRIRGLANPGCLCYCNSTIIALFASQAFRRALEHATTPLAEKLRKVFAELDKPGEALSHTKPGVLRELNEELQKIFPHLKNIYEQQDASELLSPLLKEVFKCKGRDGKEDTFKFSVVPTIERERVAKEDALKICRESVGMPPVQAMHIPSLDHEVDPSRSDYFMNMVQIKIPEGYDIFSLDNFFKGYAQLEHVDVGAILGCDENKKWLTKQKEEALIAAAGGPKGKLPSIMVNVRSRIEGVPPAFLPVYVPRFTEQYDKNFSSVSSPFLLTVPVGKDVGAQYVLRSIGVHGGATKQCGHYYTYIPDPLVIDDCGNPTRWVRVSDSAPREVCSWQQVQADISAQGVIYMYDLLPNSGS